MSKEPFWKPDDALQPCAGRIRLKYPLPEKFKNIEILLVDFSKYGMGMGYREEDNSDGRYVIILPGVPVEEIEFGSTIDDTNPKAYGDIYVNGNIVDIRPPPILEKTGRERFVNAAKKLKEELIKYLQREKIPFELSDWVE
jgi:hypothetical protein